MALIPLAILAVAAVVSLTLYLTAPVADREARPRVPRLVEVVEVMPATQGPQIEAWGEVVAARTPGGAPRGRWHGRCAQ